MKNIFILILTTLFCVSCGQYKEGVTPLMKAARDGDLQEVRTLLAEGSKVDRMSKYNWTALMFAAEKGHKEIVQELLSSGANPNIESKEIAASFSTTAGYGPSTPLAEAIRNKHVDIAFLLIDKGAKIDKLSIAIAGSIGNINLLSFMKEQNVDFNQYSGNGWFPSALCASSASGDIEIVRWLHKNGAKINVILGGFLPLRFAIDSFHPEIVKYLLENGADPNISWGDPNYHHNYFLGLALYKYPRNSTESDNILHIIRLLLEHGADAYVVDHVGVTMLDEALRNREKQKAEVDPISRPPEILENFLRARQHNDAVLKILKEIKEKN